MAMDRFQLVADFEPSGDQPGAIAGLLDGIGSGLAKQTLLGVTGSGKTFTMANVIQSLQRSTLILAPNKTLAASTSVGLSIRAITCAMVNVLPDPVTPSSTLCRLPLIILRLSASIAWG